MNITLQNQTNPPNDTVYSVSTIIREKKDKTQIVNRHIDLRKTKVTHYSEVDTSLDNSWS